MLAKDIGVKISREEFVAFLNSVRGGQFIAIKGYVNEQGEKSDQILRYGIKYGAIKDRDVALLRAVLAGKVHSPLQVTHGVWIDEELLQGAFLSADEIASLPERERAVLVNATMVRTAVINGTAMRVERTGTINPMDTETFCNRKAKGRVPATLSYAIPQSHPLVVAAIGAEDLQGTLLQGLLRPREATTDYDKEARSCYSKADDPSRWYIRDVLRVHKTVRVAGDYPFSATLPINGVKKAIQSQWLLTGKYREFVLTDGQFESITIEGQAVMVDGVGEEFYFALPETVKATMAAEAVAQ